jgi:2-polyprenyl-3-methyl-5-hydroxy-6-metoxy-1,4-benzoquinol methylase
MTQNIYDQPDFFLGYSQLRRSVHGLDGAAEWPAIRSMLPDLKGMDIIDLGCGFGWFSRWAIDQGATHVFGIDVSENMLAQAKATEHPNITYRQADLEHLTLPRASFDLAYSSLVLHYIEDIRGLFATIHGALRPGGHIVFSTEHPIYTAPTSPQWATGADSRRIWPLDRYLVEGPRTTDWLAKGVIKHHRTIGTTLTLLIQAGFTITHVEEFCPSAEQIAAQPDLEAERDRPMFLLVSARR